MTKTRTVMLVLAVFFASSVILAGINQQSDNYGALLAKLRSDNWQERAEAVEKLNTMPGALQSDEMKKALIDLQERENQLIEQTLRESNGRDGVSVKYGEDYSEYYFGPLHSAVDKVADLKDKHTLDVFVRSAYNPDSPFANKLVSYGEAIVPTLLEKANSDVGPARASALAMLGRVVADSRDRISDSSMGQIKQALVKGTGDSETYVRVNAVRALGEVGDKELIPLLERIARSDGARDSSDAGKKIKFPVREEAAKALNSLRGN